MPILSGWQVTIVVQRMHGIPQLRATAGRILGAIDQYVAWILSGTWNPSGDCNEHVASTGGVSGKELGLERSRKKIASSQSWYPRPELNWNQRFRKPLLYPFELRGQSLTPSQLVLSFELLPCTIQDV